MLADSELINGVRHVDHPLLAHLVAARREAYTGLNIVKVEHIERLDRMPALQSAVAQDEIEMERHIVRAAGQEYARGAGENTDKVGATVDSRRDSLARALEL